MPSRNTRRQWRLTIPVPLVSEHGEDDRAGRHLDLWTVELYLWEQKDWSFYCPAREYQKMLWHPSSRNCKSKNKRKDALVQQIAKDLGANIACCFRIKDWSDHSHLCQVGHHKVIFIPAISASRFCLPLFLFLKSRCSVQLKIVSLHSGRKAHMHSTPSLRSFPTVAFEAVPVFIWLMIALSCPFKGHWALPRERWCGVRGSVPQAVSHAPQNRTEVCLRKWHDVVF